MNSFFSIFKGSVLFKRSALLWVLLIAQVVQAAPPAKNGAKKRTELEVSCLSILRKFKLDPCADIRTKLIQDDNLGRIIEISENLKRICPPELCIVVGLGGSPTPFIAYLSEKNPNYAFNLPLALPRSTVKLSPYALTVTQREHLFSVFDWFLPGPEVLGGRSILLFDFIFTGTTAASGYHFMKSYLNHRYGETPPRIGFAVYGSCSWRKKILDTWNLSNRRDRGVPFGITHLISDQDQDPECSMEDCGEDPLWGTLMKHTFKPYREFNRWVAGDIFYKPSAAQPSWKYLALKWTIRDELRSLQFARAQRAFGYLVTVVRRPGQDRSFLGRSLEDILVHLEDRSASIRKVGLMELQELEVPSEKRMSVLNSVVHLMETDSEISVRLAALQAWVEINRESPETPITLLRLAADSNIWVSASAQQLFRDYGFVNDIAALSNDAVPQ